MNLPKLKNKKLFEEAFTHRSYLNEAKLKVPSNERLEFLGDSILSFAVSNYLYTKYPDFDEGTSRRIAALLFPCLARECLFFGSCGIAEYIFCLLYTSPSPRD